MGHVAGAVPCHRVAVTVDGDHADVGVEIAPHMWYGPIAHMASVQSMSGVRSFLMNEWDGANMRRLHDLSGGTLPLVENGAVKLPDTPGLSIKMDFGDWKKRFPYN